MLKPRIQNWHREEYAEGKLDNIPADVIELLRAEQKTRAEAVTLEKAEEDYLHRLDDEKESDD